MNITNIPIFNTTYNCSYNFSQFSNLNCSQIIIIINNSLCNNNNLLKKTNCTYNSEECGIKCIIIPIIFSVPFLFLIFCICKRELSECYSTVIDLFNKLCKLFKYYIIKIFKCQCLKENDLEKGILNNDFSFNIKNCILYSVEDISNKKLNCSICLEDLYKNESMEKNVINLQCNHRFHLDCISQWINHEINNNKDPSCPFCRNKIHIIKKVKEVYKPTYDSDNSYSDFDDY